MPEKLDLETKKEIAKICMTASLGVAVVTAPFINSRKMKQIHTGAGVLTVGFALWHHLLYQPKKAKGTIAAKETPDHVPSRRP